MSVFSPASQSAVSTAPSLRMGIDLGGTKLEAIVLSAAGETLWRERVPTPKQSASDIYDAIAGIAKRGETDVGAACSIGIGTPGSLSPRTGLMRGSNTVVLNGQPVKQEIEARLQREIRIANDANCFALSEAVDGAGRGAQSVFGVILGTGCGGGVVVNGAIQNGLHSIAGEWGHNPLPWPRDDELGPTEHDAPTRGAHRCYCGKWGCLETWLSGTGLGKHFANGEHSAGEIVTRAHAGEPLAEAYLKRYEDRLARALTTVINVLDPEVIVLGGGVSNVDRLYENVPPLLPKYVFSEFVETKVVKNLHGDSSGVRGAAWLW